MSKYPELILLNTRNILGHYLPKENRIEISGLLKEYPELFSFVFKHELEHSYIFFTYGFGLISLLKNLYIDMKDRYKFFSDRTLRKQRKKFTEVNTAKNIKEIIYIATYNLIGSMMQTGIIIFVLFSELIKWIIKKAKK